MTPKTKTVKPTEQVCKCGISRAYKMEKDWKCLECGKIKKQKAGKNYTKDGMGWGHNIGESYEICDNASQKRQEEWEDKFEKKFNGYKMTDGSNVFFSLKSIKAFIRNLLAKEREKYEKSK